MTEMKLDQNGNQIILAFEGEKKLTDCIQGDDLTT